MKSSRGILYTHITFAIWLYENHTHIFEIVIIKKPLAPTALKETSLIAEIWPRSLSQLWVERD